MHGPGSWTRATGQETNAILRLNSAGIIGRYIPEAEVVHRVSKESLRNSWIIHRYFRNGVEFGLNASIRDVLGSIKNRHLLREFLLNHDTLRFLILFAWSIGAIRGKVIAKTCSFFKKKRRWVLWWGANLPNPSSGVIYDFVWRALPRLGLIIKYKRAFGCLPNIVRPKTLNEIILKKLQFDRNPLLTTLADKLAVREWVKEKVGDAVSFPKIYLILKQPNELGSPKDLPQKFIMKANHGSGWSKVVHDLTCENRRKLEQMASAWLSINYGKEKNQWA